MNNISSPSPSPSSAVFDDKAAGDQIGLFLNAKPQELEPFLASIRQDNESLIRWSWTGMDPLPEVVHWATGCPDPRIFNPSNPGKSIRDFITSHFTPLIIVDLLLHISGPDPARLAVRAVSRGKSNTLNDLYRLSDWKQSLKEGNKAYGGLKLPRPANQSTVTSGPKQSYLNFWAELSKDRALPKVLGNIRSMKTVLAVYLHLLNITLTNEDIDRALACPDEPARKRKLITPLLVALANSPLCLLRNTTLSRFSSARLALLKCWRDLGNVHKLTAEDHLGQVEKIFWTKLFQLAWGVIDKEETMLREFFEEDFIKQTISGDLEKMGYKSIGLYYNEEPMAPAQDVEVIQPIEEEAVQPQSDDKMVPAQDVEVIQPTEEEPVQPQKRRRVVSLVESEADTETGSGGQLRSRTQTTTTVATTAVPSNRPSRKRRKVSVEDVDSSSPSGPWLLITDDWERLPTDAERLQHEWEDCPERRLEPTSLYALAPEDAQLPIEYWEFDSVPVLSGATGERYLPAQQRTFHYRPLQNGIDEIPILKKILACCPKLYDESRQMNVPLHAHPSAQLFHSSGRYKDADGKSLLPDIVPSDQQSMVYVTSEDEWKKLAGRQQQEILRHRCALILPIDYDGTTVSFEEGLSAFTDLDRRAWIQDLGVRKTYDEVRLRVGRPQDLLDCRRAKESANADKSQRLNLLSNPIECQSLPASSGWRNLATEEHVWQRLNQSTIVPQCPFPRGEVQWATFATEGAITFFRNNVLYTEVTMSTGDKIWILARRRTDLAADNFRGVMRSRHAFDDFDGCTDNTDVYVYEVVHLNSRTTLLMTASVLHMDIGMSDCIALGRHAAPSAQISQCVLAALHNTILTTTSVDHEPVQQFLIRIFIFWASRLTKGDIKEEFTRMHLPDISRKEGILDLMVLRSFVVLLLALRSSSYRADREDHNIPLSTDFARELSVAWRQAHAVATFIDGAYCLRPCGGQPTSQMPISFTEAANVVLVNMTVSMYRYACSQIDEDKDQDVKLARPWLQADHFFEQLSRSLAFFDNHPAADSQDLFADAEPLELESPLLDSFRTQAEDVAVNAPMLILWSADDIPFQLERRGAS
ncbi:hypothetical protein FB45DRAFT_887489 [Roridomyces roridus]|uniref:Uncharacterized protein n=1 Tax=Roridomyces roridus TaxID=1738132 RepID=A0AAD7CLI9_9AGAR|nr:hypothetical protein FB45DRAFT_887489 [Roridomyces roridus]